MKRRDNDVYSLLYTKETERYPNRYLRVLFLRESELHRHGRNGISCKKKKKGPKPASVHDSKSLEVRTSLKENKLGQDEKEKGKKKRTLTLRFALTKSVLQL